MQTFFQILGIHKTKGTIDRILKAIEQKDEKRILEIFSGLDDSTRQSILNPDYHNYRIRYFEDPFIYAISQGLVETVKAFLPYIEDINRYAVSAGTPLHSACYGAPLKIFELLLSRKDINPNMKLRFLGVTPLQNIIRNITLYGENKNLVCAALLLINDARIDVTLTAGFNHLTALAMIDLIDQDLASAELLKSHLLAKINNIQVSIVAEDSSFNVALKSPQ